MRLKPGAKVLLTLVILILIGAGAWKAGLLNGMMNVVAPDRKAGGTVEKDDFNFGKQDPGSISNDNRQVAVPPQGGGGKLNRPIRVAIVLWGGYAGGFCANNGMLPNKDSKFWKDHGIEVELIQIDDFIASRDAFRAGGDKGGVDIMWSTVDSFALEYPGLKDLNPRCILQYDWSRGGDAIAVSRDIRTASDLKGRKISVAEGTPSHFFLLYMLAQAGLNASDVKPVFTNDAIEAADLFKAEQVDACVSWSPNVYMVADERPGAQILASTREATSLIADIFVARGDFIQQYPDAVAAFCKGWLEGVEIANSNPDLAAQLMYDGFDGLSSLDDSVGMLGDVKLPNAAENRAFFELDNSTLIGYEQLYDAAQSIWGKVGLLEEKTRPGLTVNTSFLDLATTNTSTIAAAPEEEFKEFKEPEKNAAPIVTKRISVYFDTGSSTLDPNAQKILEEGAELAQTFGSAKVRVIGNTDNVGSRESNVELSRKRAQAVVDFLVSKYGFPRDKFEVVGLGPDKPIADNGSESGRAQNRRTDFEVFGQ
ncbi:OmpA family protein [bacterium]|nr:OmpA family protein [bacterium]